MNRVESTPKLVNDGRSAFSAVALVFALVGAANAFARARLADVRSLDFDSFQHANELAFGARAARALHLGELSVPWLVGLTHAVATFVALGVAIGLARSAFAPGRSRLIAFGCVALFVLHDPVTALPWTLELALVAGWVCGVRFVWSVLGLLALGLAAPAAATLGALGLALAALLAPRQRGLAFVPTAGVAVVSSIPALRARVLADVLGSDVPCWAPQFGAAHAGELAFVALGLLPLPIWFFAKKGSTRARRLLAAAAPSSVAALIQSDGGYVRLVPLAVVLVLVAVEGPGVVTAWAGVVAAIFGAGSFGSRRDVPTAWSLLAPLELRAPRHDDPSDLARTAAFLRKIHAEGAACAGVPAREVLAHPLAGVSGPSETLWPWSHAAERDFAAEIRRADCPFFVDQVTSFDLHEPCQACSFDASRLALAERYAPFVRLGPATFALRRRATPSVLERRPVEVKPLGKNRFALVPPVPWDHAVELELAGAPRALELVFTSHDEPLGAFNRVEPTGSRIVAPVHAEVAEWRWVAGFSGRESRLADAFEVRGPDVRVASLTDVSPPPAAAPAVGACEARVDLVARVRDGRAFARETSARVQADAIELDPNEPGRPLAEVFVPVRPCADACLFAEVGVDAGPGPGARFDAHVVDGWERPRIVDRTMRAGEWPSIVEVPLARWAERDVLLRFGTWPLARGPVARARVLRARVGPCAARVNLVAELADGRGRFVRGHVVVSGDTMRMDAEPVGQPPTELRIPFRVPDHACLALDYATEGRAGNGTVTLDFGVLDGRHYRSLGRETLGPNASIRSPRNLSLGEWEGRAVELRVTLLATVAGTTARAVVYRPRVQRCGDLAPWGFGAEAAP